MVIGTIASSRDVRKDNQLIATRLRSGEQERNPAVFVDGIAVASPGGDSLIREMSRARPEQVLPDSIGGDWSTFGRLSGSRKTLMIAQQKRPKPTGLGAFCSFGIANAKLFTECQ
jgi:hypothetical protein